MSTEPTDHKETETLDASRRAFLKTAGKVVVYTPPAMLVMYQPSFKAIAQSSGSGDQSPPNGNGPLDWLAELIKKLLGG
jgi:hypothetical protein